jgi:hypothetical protein
MIDDPQTGHALKTEDSSSSEVAIVGVLALVIGLAESYCQFEFSRRAR